MFAARTTHSYTNQISATLYLFPCVHMPDLPFLSPVPALVVLDSRTSRVPIASRLPAHLRNLSSSLAPALRVVFVPSPASCLVLSLRRHSSNASDVQVLALRGPGSSSSLVALFSDRGFYACQFGTSASGSIHHISFSLCFFVQAAFGLGTLCLAVLLIGPILRPFDPAIFLVFDMGEDSGGQGGGSPPCSESEEANL